VLEYQVKNISNVPRNNKIPLPQFFIDLYQSHINQDIFKLTSLSYFKIKVETPHTKNNTSMPEFPWKRPYP